MKSSVAHHASIGFSASSAYRFGDVQDIHKRNAVRADNFIKPATANYRKPLLRDFVQ